jgi:hypothetical protein
MFAESVWTTVSVLSLNPYPLTSCDVGNIARNRETALEICHITFVAHDAGIHQFVCASLRLHNCHVERLTELRGGETGARGGTHRVRKIIEKAVQQLSEAFDRFAGDAEARIAEE